MDFVRKIIEGKKITETEERVLRYIIDNFDEVLDMGVRKVAQNSYTSPSTIMRLAKKLGYTGFVDMHYRLSHQLQPQNKHTKQTHDVAQFFSTGDILEFINYDDILSIAMLIYTLKDKFVFIYANGFSSIAAEYLHKKLLVLGVKSIIANGNDSIGVFRNNLQNIGVFLVISKSGETKTVYAKVAQAKEQNIPTVSFTKETESKIGLITDYNLQVSDISKLDDLNTFPNTFFPKVFMLIEVLIFELHQCFYTDK